MRAGWHIGLAIACCITHAGCRIGFTLWGEDAAGSSAVGVGTFDALPPLSPLTGNHVLFMRDDRVFRLPTAADGVEVDVTAELDALFPGDDQFAASSRNGVWMTLASTRLACGGDPCL